MKTTFVSRSFLPLLSMFMVLNSFAQKAAHKNESAYSSSAYERSNAFPSGSNNVMGTPGSENISKKVLKNFDREFNNATNVKWRLAGKNFLATFSVGETSTRSLFDKKGRVIYTIIYGSEEQLPSEPKKIVTDNYENYTITSFAKVLQDNYTIWVIKLAGKSRYITARIEDGEIEEVENFQKAN